MNNEDRLRKEGVLFNDVIFFVRTADGLSKVIVNLEAKKSEPVKYDVEMRGISYAAREVSVQSEREFTNQHHNAIKKVYFVIVRLGKELDTRKDSELHRLLGTLFPPEMSVNAKIEVLETEFHIEMEDDRKELMRSMCNLSQGIKEQGIKLGTEQ